MISIRNLRKSYGSNHVLNGIDMDVKAGEFVVMLGLSGAGKSTLLRCMNGLNQPDSGQLQVGGIDLMRRHSRRELARHVAMVFQHHNLVQRLSVRKNVLTGRLGQVGTLASVLQLFKQSDIALADACLQRVGLAHKADERTEALSGGQMQRVGIARALAQQPQLILADEPVASLDPKTARSVLQYLRDATRELGIAVVCNLHQVDYAREFGDRIVGLSQGRMVFDGVPAMLDEAALNAIYSGEPQPAGHAPEQGAALHLSSTAVGNWLPGAMSPATAAGGLQ
ncbi:phosphonate ABC transporter ATP-binding protein [Comamonas thiooxydans]|uniref:Phosphonate ABC transporter ATP-binding protein n=1 Tax=Comamonas thiooxydans TaxID=363952 RepID=A0AA42Q248_9BURK|nr:MULTISPECIES: phosphonate ABC transporter ATP-binding protein [Comamonas]EFI62568.1 phosphonate ABC transporter, ATPase subunit [Comamonas thiooxydans]MDH1255424.1 phosphonate ABC transporter ATP-binding protein [Comamonas thiooxydans]MDH1335562.1 phosphonate ABC transporter ATP-binding protein [Comamonas thiooxydans]MDH1475844.1 phosphonate ABC transporter ATP-binding protein [Comamonas thiooxydans]MDH1743099.1 phosphonate ABC transporter ATP-binding protein [Comamonas thiooxydans]